MLQVLPLPHTVKIGPDESPFPRRNCVDHLTDAEKAIRDALRQVEVVGADVRLTDALVLLTRAADRVADFLEGRSPAATENARIQPAKTEFAWLVEAPGPHYLAARDAGTWEFFWTKDHDRAIRFHTEQQAKAVMLALRGASPKIFDFAKNLGEPKPVEHGWDGGGSPGRG